MKIVLFISLVVALTLPIWNVVVQIICSTLQET